MKENTFLLLLVLSALCRAQDFPIQEPKPINSISVDDSTFADLNFLKEEWADKRFILLGEQSHGDGATFAARVRLIKFLHQEMGFDLVLFESGMYDNYQAWKSLTDGRKITEPFKKSILPLWSETAENEALIRYVKATINLDDPLQIGGFDFIRNDYFKELLLEDVLAALPPKYLDPNELQLLEDMMLSGIDALNNLSQDTVAFQQLNKSITQKLTDHAQKRKTEDSKMLLQSFKTWAFGMNYDLDERQGKKIFVQNPRDAQMAENFIFLSNLYPDKKIVAIGASMHFADQALNVEDSPITQDYISNLPNAEDEEPFNLMQALEGVIPMGQLLKKQFGTDLFSLAFSSYEGTYGMIGTQPQELQKAPKESLEKKLSDDDYQNAYLAFIPESDEKFYLSALGNIPILGKWQTIFDGLLFIKNSSPPTPISYESVGGIVASENSSEIYGKVFDQETNLPVPFANIALIGTSKGTSSNDKGVFVFNKYSSEPTLVFSSIGYENDTITVTSSEEDLIIKLRPKSYLLNEVVVTDKPLSAKDILKLARKNRSENYFQEPMNQEFFYSTTNFTKEEMTFNEEAAIILYGDQGYKSTNNPASHFYGEILQYRNTTNNPAKNKWDGIGSLWLVLAHDIIFDKSNVLNKTSAYDLNIEGIKAYEDQMVYEITFTCRRPSAITIGYGFPAPLAATGSIYISTSDYAILKYEVCIPRQESISKKHKYTLKPWGHRLIQTYKNFRGKYFLNTSISYDYYHYKYADGRPDGTYSNMSILSATEIETENVKPIKKPIQSISVGKKVNENPSFWKSFNYLIPSKKVPVFGCQ